MNANLQPATQLSSPLMFSANEANLKSGIEMKRRWIEQVLKSIHRTNETMDRRKN